MPFTMTCPECDAELTVPDAIAGKTVRCKKCGETFKANPPAPKPGRSRRPRDDDEEPRRRPRSRDDEDEDDDRPRRRRRDDDEDDAPRSRRRDGRDEKRMMPAALVALIKGCGALVAAIIPCTAPFGAILGGLTLIFGIIALVIAKKTQRYKTGLPIAAICVGVAALVIGSAWTIALNRFFKGVDQAVTEHREAEKKEVQSGPALKVTAPELHRSFPARQLSSKSPYYHQVVEVTGTIKHNAALHTEFTSIHLDCGVEGEGVVCDFGPADRRMLQNLELGGTVTIRGRCTGRLANMVRVEDCILAPGQGGKAQAVAKTAAQLADEYAAGEKGFEARYEEKLLEVTGPVARVEREDRGGEVTVYLEGGGLTLSFRFPPADAAEAAGVTVGREVTIRGKCVSVGRQRVGFVWCKLVRR